MQYLEKDKTRGAVPRVMQKEAGQVQGGLRYLGQLFKQLQVQLCYSAAMIMGSAVTGRYVDVCTYHGLLPVGCQALISQPSFVFRYTAVRPMPGSQGSKPCYVHTPT